MSPKLVRTAARIAFTLYALVLVTATHWPQLRIEGPVPRPDLYIHLAAFGLWTSLLIATELLGPWRSRTAVAKCVALALIYAAIDEGTQAIPALGRTVALDDYLANALGVILAGIAAVIASKLVPASRPRERAEPAHRSSDG
ncbi:MAG: VanZ family protein [Planctomycetota bacterium]